MFRTSSTENILFVFSRNIYLSIHAWFVFFKFIVIWLDDKNRIVDWRIVRPFSIAVLPSKIFRKIVEIPLTTKNISILRFLDGEQRFK